MEDQAQQRAGGSSVSPNRAILNSPNLKKQLQQDPNQTASKQQTLQAKEMSPKQSMNNLNQNRNQEETQVLNGQTVRYKRMFAPQSQDITHKKDEHIINGAILNLEHSFGFLNTVIDKNSYFISEDTLVFPSGRHLATVDLISRRMDFIKREDTNYTSIVTCLQVGLSRKKELVVAIGEKSHGSTPRASIYIPSRLRWFRLDHDQDDHFNFQQFLSKQGQALYHILLNQMCYPKQLKNRIQSKSTCQTTKSIV